MIRYSDSVVRLLLGKYPAGNSAWGMVNSAGDILQSTDRINVGDKSKNLPHSGRKSANTGLLGIGNP